MYLFKFQRPISNNHHHQQPNLYFPFHKISSHSNQSVLLFNPSSPPPPFLSIPNSVQRTKSLFHPTTQQAWPSSCKHNSPPFRNRGVGQKCISYSSSFRKTGERERNRGIFLIPPFSRGRDVSTKKEKKKITSPVA